MIEPKDISVKDIKAFFNMDGAAMLKEWRALDDSEKEWFKAELAREINEGRWQRPA